MQTDSLLDKLSAREMDLAPLRYGTWTHQAPINARRPPFDPLTIGLHWGTVLLVLVLFASAWLHARAETLQSDFTPVLLQIHRSSGVTIWVVTALRLAWRLTNASLPPFPAQMTKLHRATVKLSGYGLYALLIGQPATGLLTTLFGGRPFALYLWQLPPLMHRDVTLQAAFHFSHELGAWALAGLVVGHAAAALFHHFVLRDYVLESMAPVIAMARPKQELATGHIVPETRSGNKSDPLAVLLTRRGNGDEPAKCHDVPDTSGISQSSLWRSCTMPILSRRTVAALAVSLGLLGVLGFAVQSRAATDNNNVVQALRAGGIVIVVRHGATFPDQADTDPLNFDNIAAQRNLNDKGKALAKTFGDALRQAGVPIGKVYTSKYNRAYETAVIAGFKNIEKTADITEGGLVVSPNENNRRIDAFRKLLGTAPTPGTNTILITHKPNIVDALGKDWFDIKEGEASLFRPENGSYKLIARVQMEDWPHITAAAK
jgi:cytochrome b561/phosphohistidine phosphatase SixA